MDIEEIRRKLLDGKYIVSFTHTEKLRVRRIRAQELEQVAQVGTIIEEYPNDPRGPSCLIFGLAGKRPLHVLCGRLDAEEILVITAYEPDQGEWENDGRTRKKK